MFELKLLSGALGAELYGVNLAKDLSNDVLKEMRRLLVEHEVIFFRDQDISHEQHKQIAHFFGPLQTHPAYGTVPDFPEITILESTAEKPTKIEKWHTDMTFREHPPMGSILRSKICPPSGGDTLWSSMTSAYEALSQPMKDFLDNLNAEHDFSHGFKESLAEPGGRERLKDAIKDNPPVIHPVIQTHPESGKKVIFVNTLFTTKIIELSADESNSILNFLYDYIKTPEFTCRFSWEPNSIAFWDNRSTQHKPVNDYFPSHRMLERITIDGNKPY
ncbi:MAG: taurine dioxygenase [Pseudomonadota bacterium]|nr:taurine dioxygenase [Pseudomonadota bacterium]|tara:strand:+ start:589 stop:1413 length:825 start_codon:yes stop_codon:yes gene_type:complete